ncbi:MAG: hypothetical protein ACQEP9_00315 [Bacillota bacterium]
MRRDNSDFVTEFVTSAGDFKTNKDYFAFVELDDYACWVLADGLDSSTEQLSSEIVVNSILSDFTENPTLKKRKIKKYIRNANQTLAEKSRTMNLQSTVLVIVSDYHSIRWAYLGNTRLYHLRKERIKNQTKDHSIAQMMLEVGDIEPQQLNQHQERNNLDKYLGNGKKAKPKISKKVELKDDDILILCTSGFWENMKDQQLKSDLEEIEEPQELVDNLETKMLSNSGKDLDNYSLATIFVNKVLQEKSKKSKFSIKKIAMFLVPILLLSGGAFLYNKRVSRIRSKVTAAKSKLNRASRLVKKGQGSKAKPELKKSRESFKKLGKDEQIAKIDKQLELIDAQELEKKGDEKIQAGNYVEGLSNYKRAKTIYLKVGEYDLKEIENKIFRCNRILKAKDYEGEAKESYKSGSYNEAKQKYNLAAEIYRQHNAQVNLTEINTKLEETTEKITNTDQSNKISDMKAEANEYLQMGDYKNAINKYIEAKVICSNLGLTEEVKQINNKIKQINNNSVIKKAEEYEDDAEIELNKQNFSEAIFNYKQAEKIYSEYSMSAKVAKVREKIASIETAQLLDEAETTEKLGDEQFKNQKYDQALDSYQQVEKIYSGEDMEDKVNKVTEKIIDVQATKKFKRAKEYEKSGDELAQNEKYDKSLAKYKQAKDIYQEVNKLEDFNRVQQKIEKANQGKKGFFSNLFS